MITRLTEQQLLKMLEGLSDPCTLGDMLEFGKAVQDEVARRETILRRREYCAEQGGHVFLVNGGGVKEMEYSNGQVEVKWDGYGTCPGCDAVLGVTYKDTLA